MMGVMASELDIRAALKQVLDPEIGVNIVDLGLVYRIEVEGTRALVVMTMTSPACPLADYLKELVTAAINERVPGVTDVDIAIEWDPPWNPDMMSDEARRQLGDGPG
jgi:metal-sulfur cluster biosynthetic enzyme